VSRLSIATLAATAAAVVTLSAQPTLISPWRAPDASEVSFAGKKVAALIITPVDSLRVAGEEALQRELTALGLNSVATYRIVPKEELQSADRAKVWFEKASVEGVVALRPVSNEKRTVYNPSIWAGPSYSSLWGYYGYGWGSVYIPGSVDSETIVTVETLIYSVPRNQLVWAAASETRNPKTLQKFVEDLVKEAVKELDKQGLARNISR
jgi:hypothetical protein